MKEKDQKIIRMVYEEFTNGYWGSDDAMKYTSMLYPFVEPNQKVRDALKALKCKRDKDSKFQDSRGTLETRTSFRDQVRELEYILEREGKRYGKKYPEGEKRDSRDMFMMLLPMLAASKPSISITLDVNQLNSQIYGECKECPIREICKEAFSVATEYVSYALNKLDFEIPQLEE